MLTLTQPVDRGGGKVVLEFGSTYFEVTPGHGARVTSWRYAGQELLMTSGPADNADMYGSTFWPSPQALWTWPPPPEIDNGAYTSSVDASHVITAVGNANAKLGLSVTKKFTANLQKEAVEIEYLMTNNGSAPKQAAPWEITRVPATGIAFWPSGGAPSGPAPLLATEAVAGHTWCTPSATPGVAKVFADGMGGWLAYVFGDNLLIKQFQDEPASKAAAGEAEVEIYVNAAHTYVEVEQQGAFASIPPGASVPWKVTWYARKLPAGLTATVGNPDLVAFVTQTLQ